MDILKAHIPRGSLSSISFASEKHGYRRESKPNLSIGNLEDKEDGITNFEPRNTSTLIRESHLSMNSSRLSKSGQINKRFSAASSGLGESVQSMAEINEDLKRLQIEHANVI